MVADHTVTTGVEDTLDCASRWCAEGKAVALATVISTWGSSPCPVGSQMAVAENGAFAGSVSGGCIESTVVHAALDVIRQGEARTLEFTVTGRQAWDVGLACGGTLRIYVETIE